MDRPNRIHNLDGVRKAISAMHIPSSLIRHQVPAIRLGDDGHRSAMGDMLVEPWPPRNGNKLTWTYVGFFFATIFECS